MKNLYSILLVIVFSFLNIAVHAQITERELGEFTTKESYLNDFEIFRRAPKCCGERTVPNLTFYYTSSSAISNHDRVQQAREDGLNAWFYKQYQNFEKEIEKQLKKSYPNFEQARNDFLKRLEKNNVLTSADGVRRKYNRKIRQREGIKDNSIRDLKLLELRENEIKLGNINTTSYGSFNFNGTPIGNIRSLSQLNALRNQEISTFGRNEWTLHDARGVLKFLRWDIYGMDKGNYNYPILNVLLQLQISHIRSYDSWERLDVIQMYLNNVRFGTPLAIHPVEATDFGGLDFVENYANRHRRGNTSIFDPDYIDELVYRLASGMSWDEFEQEESYLIDEAERIVREKQEDYIDSLVGSINDVDFKIQSVIETLGYANASDEADWLHNNHGAGEDMFNLLNVGNQYVKSIINVLSNNSLTTEQKFERLLELEDRYNPTPTNITQTDLDRIVKEYAKEFRRRGNIEFADYLESLLPINPATFTQGDRWDLINLIKREKVNYTLQLAKEIVSVTYDSFQPLIEFALFEIGGSAAFKLLSKLPVKYITKPIRNILRRLRTPSSKAWQGFRHAKKFGFKSYDEFVRYFDDLNLSRSELGVEIHHLFEKRLAQSPVVRNFLGSNTGNWKSIILTPAEHQHFTNAWRNAIGYRGRAPGWTGYTTDNVTVEALKRAAREIYKDYPEILKALGL
ncbi:MAG: hypothetical protein V3V33_05660 [Candidatus Lokiarchaeia archaeon]